MSVPQLLSNQRDFDSRWKHRSMQRKKEQQKFEKEDEYNKFKNF
jgi:hypothetical protein